MLFEFIWDSLHPFPHVGQLFYAVGFLIELPADGLELFTGLKHKTHDSFFNKKTGHNTDDM